MMPTQRASRHGLPDIGATVRTPGGGTGTVERHLQFARRADGSLSPPAAFVRWPKGGGAWFTADEIDAHLCRLADCPTCLADRERTDP